MSLFRLGPRAVIVYSPDQVRGQIISAILLRGGIPVHGAATLAEVETMLDQGRARVVVIDVHHHLPTCMPFLTRWAQPRRLGKRRLAVILQSLASANQSLRDLKLRCMFCLPDPIDPLLLLEAVKRTRPSLVYLAFSFLKKIVIQTKRMVLKTLIIAFILAIGLIGGYVITCITSLPPTQALENYTPYQSTLMYSQDNVLLTEFYIQRRTYTPLSQVPPHVIFAVIAIEDARFYQHPGIDVVRIGGALLADLRDRAFAQGASTITQQLAKMLFLKPDKTITRKVKEIALSFKIEKKYAKERILEMYLNQAYFGARAYGVEAASRTYFGKPITAVTIAEAALLAGLLKAPSSFSPYKHPRKALNRRNLVLKQMMKYEYIGADLFRSAVSAPMPQKFHGRKYKAPYFVDYCRALLEAQLGDRLFSTGLKIYTTLDYKMQEIAEQAVLRRLDELEKRCDKGLQAALLAVELESGRIRAMVGGRDFWISQFNRATQAKRQPGSAFKPIIYLTALNRGYEPEDIILDQETTYPTDDGDTWTPRNYTGVYHGRVTLKQALAHSYNAAAVYLATRVGIKNVIRTARRLGVASEIKPYLSSALGASEMTLLELVYVYAAFANGRRMEPTAINRIIDRDTLSITEPGSTGAKVVGDQERAALKSLLREVVMHGSGRRAAALNREVFGKTGTTDDYVDAWFIGFDDRMVVGVWVGRDTQTPIGEGEAGSKAALPLWIEFMKNVHEP